MNSLLQLFNSLPQNQWDYYSEIQAEGFLQNPFGENAISNEEFIKQYFFRSGKERIIRDKNFDIKSSLTEQAAHTTSIFFLGSLIYHKTRIRELLFPQEMNPAGYSVFPFLWFLSCLFHDLGYNYETESNQYLASIHDIDSVKGKFKIKHDFRREELAGTSTILIASLASYFALRRFNDKKLDHGIVAGFYLFDKLVKNRQKKFRTDRRLFWGKALEKQYAIAAATIACHNIWVKSDRYQNIYSLYELDALKDFSPIKMTDFPFLYLLGIVDTMDPMKAYQREGHSANEILNGILLNITDSSLTFSKTNESTLDMAVLVAQTKSLIGWLDVGIEVNDNIIILSLK